MSIPKSAEGVRRIVRDYYGEMGRTGAIPAVPCCGAQTADLARRSGYTDADLGAVPDGANLGVGCGAPLAEAMLETGEIVLDLGSGGGFDALLAVKEVGPTGRVIGVDMTPEMLDRARKNAASAGATNVEFRAGDIEALPVPNGSVDVVISNCVINLVPDKAQVYREVARVLRPGGRMVVSDVVLDAPLPAGVAEQAVAIAGCVAGAALRTDYLAAIRSAGFVEIQVLRDTSFGEVALALLPEAVVTSAKAANIDVESIARSVRSLTIRAQKPPH
jgi:SAM-dependent methyltransferase